MVDNGSEALGSPRLDWWLRCVEEGQYTPTSITYGMLLLDIS